MEIKSKQNLDMFKLNRQEYIKLIYKGLISWIIIYLIMCIFKGDFILGTVGFVTTTLFAVFILYLFYKSEKQTKKEIENFNKIFSKDFKKTKNKLWLKYENENFTDEEFSYLAAIKVIKLYAYYWETEEQLIAKYSITSYPFALKKLEEIELKEKEKLDKQNQEKYKKLVQSITNTNRVYVDDVLRCPKCNSTQLTSNKKGFGLGKAAIGGIIAGPIGLLGGFTGNQKVRITCLKCGYYWTAGK